jgi:hypothetical protein
MGGPSEHLRHILTKLQRQQAQPCTHPGPGWGFLLGSPTLLPQLGFPYNDRVSARPIAPGGQGVKERQGATALKRPTLTELRQRLGTKKHAGRTP